MSHIQDTQFDDMSPMEMEPQPKPADEARRTRLKFRIAPNLAMFLHIEDGKIVIRPPQARWN